MFFKLLMPVLLWSIMAVGCSDDNETPTPAPTIEITTEVPANTPVVLVPGNTYKVEFKAENTGSITANSSAGWQVDINPEEGYAEVTVLADDTEGTKEYKMTLTAQGSDGTTQTSEAVWFYCIRDFSDPKGAFVLNEGNMTSENGSLIYITPEGYVLDNAYKTVNGTELGNVCQDMWFHDGKIYIISQNGNKNPVGTEFDNDGMLVIADAKTLKKVDALGNDDLAGLTWPSHIGVLDEEHVYIRDNGSANGETGNGQIWRLNTKTREIKALEGSTGAPKAPFKKIGNSLYTFKNAAYLVKLLEINAASDIVASKNLPFSIQKVNGIETDGTDLWIMHTDYAQSAIGKVAIDAPSKWIKDIKVDYDVDADGGEEAAQTGKSSGKVMAVYNNKAYYLYDTAIYMADFSKEDTPEETPGTGGDEEPESPALVDLYDLDSEALKMYNGISINPTTGILYANSIKGYGNFFTTNSIWGFDTNGSMENYLYKFDDYTHFPAGIYFPNANN